MSEAQTVQLTKMRKLRRLPKDRTGRVLVQADTFHEVEGKCTFNRKIKVNQPSTVSVAKLNVVFSELKMTNSIGRFNFLVV